MEINENEEMAKMANVLGHEIRNILANLTNASYLIRLEIPKLQEANPQTKSVRNMDIIDRAIKSLENIVQNMLDFSRTKPPFLSEFDVNEIVRKVFDSLHLPESIKANLELSKTPAIYADKEEITNALKNGVRNAVESMIETASGILKITTGLENNMLKIVISDNGCGIPPENMEKIFKPFFTTKQKCSGLGLNVINRIICQRHKGKIDIQSTQDKGTVLSIFLPLNKQGGGK